VISHFDKSVDQRKQELRIERWHQILRFQRKPNKIQAKILREDIRFNLCFLAVVGGLLYWLF
jgi:hypothetical protein